MLITFHAKSVMLAAILALAHIEASWAQELLARCTHAQGDRLYKGSTIVSLERSVGTVNIRQAPPSQDVWTYRIIFEDSSLGFRAIRAAKPEGGSTPLDILLGGELIYFIDGADRRLVVTAINAASGQVSSGVMSCRNTP